MATATVQPSPTQSTGDVLETSSRTLAISLLWSALMLAILGLWLKTKFDDLSALWIGLVWVLAVVSLGCGVWHFLTLGKPDAQKHALLQGQRSLLGLLSIVGGFVLMGIALYVGVTYRLAAFGEVIGMCVMGIVAIVGARNILQEQRPADSHPFFDLLRRQHARVGLVLLVVGIGLALTALGLIFLAKLGQDWFPEIASLLVLGFLGVGSGTWLVLSVSGELTTARLRIFVLVVGGVAGLILSVGALTRALVWRDDVFGGMRVWQGDRAWHLWLCAYVELLGLALMFTSLLLARTDIRSSAVLRRALYGYNAVLTGLLLLATLVVANIVLFAMFPLSFEWSKSRGAHTLSTSSKNVLANLREPTTIYVLIPKAALTTELRNFLENCQNASTKLEVKFLSPDKDFEAYENLAKRFPDSLSGRVGRLGAVDRGILIVYGAIPSDTTKKVPHAFVPTSRLVDQQPLTTKEEGPKSVLVFKGESEVMTELSSLSQDRKKRKVYILQGDGELDINVSDEKMRRDLRVDVEPLGCGQLVERLKKDQFDVQGLSFAQQLAKDKTTNIVYAQETGPEKRKEVPEDAEAILIAGPSIPLGAPTLDALERYMDRGGRLLVYLDVVVDLKGQKLKTSGLEDFLRKYGVLVGTDFPMRVPRQGDPREVIATVPKDATNDLAKAFEGEPMVLSSVRIVRPDTSAQKYKPEVILQLDPTERRLQQLYWVETAVRALGNPMSYVEELARQGALQARLSAEPIPVAVAVSEKLAGVGTVKESFKPRLVVFGDAEMISNLGLLQGRAEAGDLPYAWTASALEWVAEKKGGQVGPRPREATSYTINPQKVDVDRLRYLPGWLMMLGIVGLGAGIWVVRRR